MTRTDLRMYEYACHEGNHDFGFILSGGGNSRRKPLSDWVGPR